MTEENKDEKRKAPQPSSKEEQFQHWKDIKQLSSFVLLYLKFIGVKWFPSLPSDKPEWVPGKKDNEYLIGVQKVCFNQLKAFEYIACNNISEGEE